MKKILLTVLLGALLAPAAFAQGSFAGNNFTGQGTVVVGNPAGPVAGADYLVQFFWGTAGTLEGNLVAIGSPSALFGVTGDVNSGAGFFDFGTVIAPSAVASPIALQLRAWAASSPGQVGTSSVFSQAVAFGTGLPPDLANFGTVVVPVPVQPPVIVTVTV